MTTFLNSILNKCSDNSRLDIKTYFQKEDYKINDNKFILSMKVEPIKTIKFKNFISDLNNLLYYNLNSKNGIIIKYDNKYFKCNKFEIYYEDFSTYFNNFHKTTYNYTIGSPDKQAYYIYIHLYLCYVDYKSYFDVMPSELNSIIFSKCDYVSQNYLKEIVSINDNLLKVLINRDKIVIKDIHSILENYYIKNFLDKLKYQSDNINLLNNTTIITYDITIEDSYIYINTITTNNKKYTHFRININSLNIYKGVNTKTFMGNLKKELDIQINLKYYCNVPWSIKIIKKI